MSNLLPEKEKKHIKKRYFARLFGVILMFLAITIFLSLVFSLPSYFLSINKVKVSKERIDFIKSYVDKKRETGITSTVVSTNEKINILALPEEEKLNKFILSILEIRPTSVSITSFVLRDIGDEKNLLISGKAEKRDELIAFSNSLKSISLFKDAELPISNLAQNTDIDFNIKITISTDN